MDKSSRVTGWWVFAGVLLFVAGALNIIYGIAAVGDSRFVTQEAVLVAANLNTYGWVTIVIGVVQLTAGVSLFGGGGWGRFVGIIASALSAIAAALTIPALPIWSLCLFILSIVVLYELATAPEADRSQTL